MIRELAEVPKLGVAGVGGGREWREATCGTGNLLAPTNVQQVLVLVDTGADCNLVYRNLDKFPGKAVFIESYGGQSVKVKPVSLHLGIGHLAPHLYSVYISPIPEFSGGGHFGWSVLT